METLTKSCKVLNAIISIKELSVTGDDLYIHPKHESLKNISVLDLDSLLHKFEKDEKILLIKKLSNQSPRKSMNDSAEYWNLPDLGNESYIISLNHNFDSYHHQIQSKANNNKS